MNCLTMYQQVRVNEIAGLGILVLTSARIGTTRRLDGCKICRFRSSIGVRRLHFLQNRTRFPIA